MISIVVSSINITATVPNYDFEGEDPEVSFLEVGADEEEVVDEESDFFELSDTLEGDTADFELLSDCAPFL